MNATYDVRTPPGVGAIAAIDVVGDVDLALGALDIAKVDVGQFALRNLANIDRGVVARWSERACTLMPHGGPAVISALCDALERSGIRKASSAPLEAFPEADDALEAIVFEAIAHAESPRAVDLLLDQARRWRAWRGEPSIDLLRDRARALECLLRPPVVVALGSTNIGKSTLLNALARRDVSIAHDAPGVTRDVVGASLVLDGLAVRWVDAPGLGVETDDLAREAAHRAIVAAKSADLLILCADARSGWPEPAHFGLEGMRSIRVGLRSDLGAAVGAEVSTSASTGAGLHELAIAIRRAMVPDAALLDPSPWLFDDRVIATLSFPADSPRS